MATSLHLIVLVYLWPQMQALQIAIGNVSTPSFFMMDNDLGELYTSGFEHHPARVDTLEEADFVVTCCFRLGSLDKFNDLPRRSKAKPYLVMAHGLDMDQCIDELVDCTVVNKLIASREDFMFVNFDLRDHMLTDNRAPLLPGVTMAPPKYYSGPPLSPLQNPKYFFTFRGKANDGYYGSAHVRSQIQEAFQNVQSNDTVVEFLPERYNYTAKDTDRYNDLLNTSYGLVPHGDGRWNYRFSEVIGACAIPVIIADGLTLPFQELIDWKTAAVVLEEETYVPKSKENSWSKHDGTKAYLQMLLHPELLLKQLPTNPDQIQEMRRRVCEINDLYFSSEEKRVTALLKSAAMRADHHRHHH